MGLEDAGRAQDAPPGRALIAGAGGASAAASIWPCRFIAHAAADGGRWAGLCGSRGGPGSHLLLSCMVCDTLIIEEK